MARFLERKEHREDLFRHVQLNNYVPCSFVLDDDTTFLRKYAATLEASFAIPHPQIESTAWSADQECKPFYKNAACIRYKIFTTNFCFSVVENFFIFFGFRFELFPCSQRSVRPARIILH